MKVVTIERDIAEILCGKKIDGLKDPAKLIAVNDGRQKAFVSSPLGTERNPVTQLLGVLDGEVIGRMNCFPLEIVADDVLFAAACGDSLFVRDEFRGSMYAVTLMNRLNNLSTDQCSLSAGFSKKAQKLILLIKNVVFPLRKKMVLKHSKFVLSSLRQFRFIAHFSWAVDFALAVYRAITWISARMKIFGYKLVDVTEDELAVEQFAALIGADRARFRENMSAKILFWILKNDFHPDTLIRKRLWAYRKHGENVAFVMTRESREQQGVLGRIIEWQTEEKSKSLEPVFLLNLMHHILHFSDCAMIEVGDGDASRFGILSGFLPGLGMNVVSIGLGRMSKLRSHVGYDQVKNWRIRSGMGDMCFF